MPDGYPTKEEIAEFLEAKRKGGVEAIANLLRAKQSKREAAKANQEQQTEKPQSYSPVLSRSGAKRRGDPNWGNPPQPENQQPTETQPALEQEAEKDISEYDIVPGDLEMMEGRVMWASPEKSKANSIVEAWGFEDEKEEP